MARAGTTVRKRGMGWLGRGAEPGDYACGTSGCKRNRKSRELRTSSVIILSREYSMLRRVAIIILALTAGSVRAHTAAAQAPAAMDSAHCAAVHSALRQHFANLQLDSTQALALHTMLLAHAGIVRLDSAQLASVQTTVHQAMASGAIDADHIAMFHAILSDSSHLAAMRSCFAASESDKMARRQ